MKSEQTKSMHYTVSLISANQNSDFIKIKSDLDVKLCSKLILALVENQSVHYPITKIILEAKALKILFIPTLKLAVREQ